MRTSAQVVYAAGDACSCEGTAWSSCPSISASASCTSTADAGDGECSSSSQSASASSSQSASGSHWFQIRLWTQARAMGEHVAHCMLADLRAIDAFASQQQQQEAVGEAAGQKEPGRRDETHALSLSWPPPAELVPDTLTGFAFELFAHNTTFFGFKVLSSTRTPRCDSLSPVPACSFMYSCTLYSTSIHIERQNFKKFIVVRLIQSNHTVRVVLNSFYLRVYEYCNIRILCTRWTRMAGGASWPLQRAGAGRQLRGPTLCDARYSGY